MASYKEKQVADTEGTTATIRKEATVVVIAGSDKGKRGRVLDLLIAKERVIVEGVNLRRCIERSADGSSKEFQDKECPIHISNVMLEERHDARKGE